MSWNEVIKNAEEGKKKLIRNGKCFVIYCDKKAEVAVVSKKTHKVRAIYCNKCFYEDYEFKFDKTLVEHKKMVDNFNPKIYEFYEIEEVS